MTDFHKIFFEGATYEFAMEIIWRTLFMFLLILIVLRLSGRRGVRQLTLFEVAIILGLGSAAGDPMFQADIPIVYAMLVMFAVILVYKFITWVASHSTFVTQLMEGKEMIVVKDGMFSIKESKESTFTQREFFAELRNYSIEHLGQVRIALLEVDGSMSIIRYDKQNIKYGLPLFPDAYKEINPLTVSGPYACMFCGYVEHKINSTPHACPHCQRKKWTKAINSPYVQ